MSALSIALFTSTKGHFGRRDIYQTTVDKLRESIPDLYWDVAKYAHIKVSPDEQDIAQQMSIALNNQGFTVVRREGEWSHNDPSHATEYYGDMFNLFDQTAITSRPYFLHLEDDWVFQGDQTQSCFRKALSFLSNYKSKLCVRFNATTDQDIEGRFAETPYENILSQNENYTQYGPTLTFQPTVMRTADWWHALLQTVKQPHLLRSMHCELLSGELMKNFTTDPQPFCFFDPAFACAEHIGGPDFEWLTRLQENQRAFEEMHREPMAHEKESFTTDT